MKNIKWAVFLTILIIALIGTALVIISLHNEKELARQDVEFRFGNQCREEMINMLIGFRLLLDDNNHIKNLCITENDTEIKLSSEELYKALKQTTIPFDTLARWDKKKSFVDSNCNQYHISIKGKKSVDKQVFLPTKIITWANGVNKVNENGKGDDVIITSDLDKKLILSENPLRAEPELKE